jgi:hypothetical protein
VHKVEVDSKGDHKKEEGSAVGESRETEGGEQPRRVDGSTLTDSEPAEGQGQMTLRKNGGAESEQKEEAVAERNGGSARAEADRGADRDGKAKDTSEPEGRTRTAAVQTEESGLEPVPGGRKRRKHVRNSRSFWVSRCCFRALAGRGSLQGAR